jgi:CheY-like chemotaxis protein
MGLQMPEMDGFETTAVIREHEQLTGSHIPIIALTAHTAQSDRTPFEQAWTVRVETGQRSGTLRGYSGHTRTEGRLQLGGKLADQSRAGRAR